MGSGGFVADSVLPNITKGMVRGIITKNAVKATGLAEIYNLKLYSSLHEAKQDDCTTAYICSSNWTHLSWIKEAHKIGMKVICEKPLITEEQQLSVIQKLGRNIYGSMLKRAHPKLRKLTGDTDFRVSDAALDSLDYKDSRRGGFLFVELIHYIDLALYMLGADAEYRVQGNRIKGGITFKNRSRRIRILYDFDSDVKEATLPFHPDMIKALTEHPEKVIVPISNLVQLYRVLFDIDRQLRGGNL